MIHRSTRHLSKKSARPARPKSSVAVALKKTGGGVVSFCLRRPRGKSSRASFTPSQLIAVVQTGLPIEELKDLQASLQMPMEQLVPLLGISKATLHRRKTGGRLGAAESDRVVRFARLMGQAVEVMESTAGARHWLNSPQFGLGGAVPLAYAGTEIGAREVEDLLGRIEHGVYS